MALFDVAAESLVGSSADVAHYISSVVVSDGSLGGERAHRSALEEVIVARLTSVVWVNLICYWLTTL